MALPNTSQLTSQLARLPDAALKQMAMMHKNDPYTLPLIIAEDGRRKELRQAAQTAAYQPQPKVVDQDIASIGPLPEQVGIGALPAQNMAHMADGGIAGYAEGGPNPASGPAGQLAYNNEPVLRMAEGGVARYAGKGDSLVRTTTGGKSWFLDVPETIRDPSVAWYRQIPNPAAQGLAGVEFPTREAAIAAYDRANAVPTGTLPATASKFGDYGPSMYGSDAPAAEDKAAPKADAASAKTDYSLLNMGTPRTGGGVADLGKQYSNILAGQKSEDPAAAERAALQKQMVSGAEAAKAEIEAAQAKQGDVYKGREERLAKREQELEKSKENNTGLALLEAGLAIMSTPGHWAQAIGQGARAGTAKYAEGVEKLRAAQERLGEARDRMEDLKINRDDMNAREIRQANNEINRAKMDAQKMGIDAIMARDNVNRDTAGKIFAATVQQSIAAMETGSRERIAAMPGANERIALLLGGGNLEKGLERLTSIQAGKFNPMTAYTEYLSKRKEGDTTLSPAEFVNQVRSVSALMAGAPSASSKPTGKVYE